MILAMHAIILLVLILFCRNETVDATHLCEFHQVEGVIADYGLTLGGLMEFMDIFFGKMGVKKSVNSTMSL